MIPERSLTHDEEANALLTDVYREKQNIAAAVKVVAKRSQALEDLVWDVLMVRLLDNAEGVWLDAYGDIVGERRGGRGDVAYKAAIRVRIKVNRSKGRTVDLIEIALLLDASARYSEYFPLAWQVEIYDTELAGDFIRLLAQAKCAGSYGTLVTSTSPEEDLFVFTDALGPTLDDCKWGSAI